MSYALDYYYYYDGQDGLPLPLLVDSNSNVAFRIECVVHQCIAFLSNDEKLRPPIGIMVVMVAMMMMMMMMMIEDGV